MNDIITSTSETVDYVRPQVLQEELHNYLMKALALPRVHYLRRPPPSAVDEDENYMTPMAGVPLTTKFDGYDFNDYRLDD